MIPPQDSELGAAWRRVSERTLAQIPPGSPEAAGEQIDDLRRRWLAQRHRLAHANGKKAP